MQEFQIDFFPFSPLQVSTSLLSWCLWLSVQAPLRIRWPLASLCDRRYQIFSDTKQIPVVAMAPSLCETYNCTASIPFCPSERCHWWCWSLATLDQEVLALRLAFGGKRHRNHQKPSSCSLSKIFTNQPSPELFSIPVRLDKIPALIVHQRRVPHLLLLLPTV